jgi:hypothetical protein
MKIMKVFALIALLIGIGAVPALAQMYDFTYTGSYFQATGTLDLVSGLAVSGSGTLTYDNGTVTTTPITLFPLNPAMEGNISGDGIRSNGTDLNGLDNLVFPGSNPLLDGAGLIFWMGSTAPAAALADTGTHPNFGTVDAYNIYSSGSYASIGVLGGPYTIDSGSFTLTSVPDGGTTLALLGLAVAGLAGLRRKLSV